jgi:serine/threonine protein kinase
VAVDLFATAIILFIFISGTPPFAKADPKADPHFKLLCTGKADVFWKAHERNKPKRSDGSGFFSMEFKDMITAMLALDPNSRPTIEQLKGHAWFLGETPTFDQVHNEFLNRKKAVDEEIQRQRDAKEKQKNGCPDYQLCHGRHQAHEKLVD